MRQLNWLILIVCNSSRNGKYFYCEVRKPEYTPPELQDIDGEVWRVKNHDYFALSVLAFQLLFLSWHPFWGKPVTKQTLKLKGIEESIKETSVCLWN